MAAALLRAHAERLGDTLHVESAGTWGVDGEAASPLARRVMSDRGILLDDHIARTVNREMLEKADLVIVMTRSHRDALVAEFPSARGKIHLMSKLNGMEYDIADPYGKPIDAYLLCANDLEQLIQQGYPQIQSWLAPKSSPVPHA
jgi:protein-tyrosine phosphatase